VINLPENLRRRALKVLTDERKKFELLCSPDDVMMVELSELIQKLSLTSKELGSFKWLPDGIADELFEVCLDSNMDDARSFVHDATWAKLNQYDLTDLIEFCTYVLDLDEEAQKKLVADVEANRLKSKHNSLSK